LLKQDARDENKALGGMMASSINDSTVDIMKRIMEGDLAHHV
jgi:hypothetical protein